MPNLKAFALSTISVITLLSLSSQPAKASFSSGGTEECEYIRRNINSRLPKGVNLTRSVVTEVTVKGYTGRQCVVYGDEAAIRYALNDYRKLPTVGLSLPNGTITREGKTLPNYLIYGWSGSYKVIESGTAIIILTDSSAARD
jgi:hypothetical protein